MKKFKIYYGLKNGIAGLSEEIIFSSDSISATLVAEMKAIKEYDSDPNMRKVQDIMNDDNLSIEEAKKEYKIEIYEEIEYWAEEILEEDIIKILTSIKDKYPNLRLGQIIGNTTVPDELYYITDQKLIDRLQKMYF
jgi:hypothetical protein